LKIPFGNVFEGFLTRFLNYICIFKAFGVISGMGRTLDLFSLTSPQDATIMLMKHPGVTITGHCEWTLTPVWIL
jgi:hypothetical protein